MRATRATVPAHSCHRHLWLAGLPISTWLSTSLRPLLNHFSTLAYSSGERIVLACANSCFVATSTLLLYCRPASTQRSFFAPSSFRTLGLPCKHSWPADSPEQNTSSSGSWWCACRLCCACCSWLWAASTPAPTSVAVATKTSHSPSAFRVIVIIFFLLPSHHCDGLNRRLRLADNCCDTPYGPPKFPTSGDMWLTMQRTPTTSLVSVSTVERPPESSHFFASAALSFQTEGHI